MRNFNQGGGRRFGSDRGPVTMHRATCSKCNKACEVPFRPTGDKPIYCNDCFGANRGSTSSPQGGDRGGSFGGDRFPRREFSSSRGNERFPRKDFGGFGGDEVKKQLEFLGLKIDRLTKAVENLSATKTGSTKEKSAQVKEALKGLSISKEVTTKTPVKKVTKKKIKKA